MSFVLLLYNFSFGFFYTIDSVWDKVDIIWKGKKIKNLANNFFMKFKVHLWDKLLLNRIHSKKLPRVSRWKLNLEQCGLQHLLKDAWLPVWSWQSVRTCCCRWFGWCLNCVPCLNFMSLQSDTLRRGLDVGIYEIEVFRQTHLRCVIWNSPATTLMTFPQSPSLFGVWQLSLM